MERFTRIVGTKESDHAQVEFSARCDGLAYSRRITAFGHDEAASH